MIHFKTSEFIADLMALKSAFELANIPCFIKNEFTSGAMGELPYTETWPQLWLNQDSDVEQALIISKAINTESTALADWVCPDCDEKIEKEFQLCWQCGHVLAVE